MAVGWFVTQLAQRSPSRFGPNAFEYYCPVDDLVPQILADLGATRWAEAPGGQYVVKVRASASTLAAVAALPNVVQLPVSALTSPLNTLTAGQKTAIVNRLTGAPPGGMGIPSAALTAALGADIGTHTLGDVLRFAVGVARAQGAPRWTGAVLVYDQPFVAPSASVDSIEAAV
jgi:hypothetical protein